LFVFVIASAIVLLRSVLVKAGRLTTFNWSWVSPLNADAAKIAPVKSGKNARQAMHRSPICTKRLSALLRHDEPVAGFRLQRGFGRRGLVLGVSSLMG
jgi:hypothetical protein